MSRWAPLSVVVVAVAARARTFGNPVIGFDEQFYLLVGDRMLHGALPYVDLFDRKPIGLFAIYAGARLFGGDGFLAYKLVALAFVVATALLIFRQASRSAGAVASLTAASLYIVWLDFMEGEGGQSPVFYALPMLAAAMLVMEAGRRPDRLRRCGAAAMLLVGVALQIKYSVLIEGVFFGCWLVAAGWRRGQRGATLAASTLLWIGCALLPTVATAAVYAAHGHLDAFVFANFVSVFGQGRPDVRTQALGALEIVGILAPLWLTLLVGRRGRRRGVPSTEAFLLAWLAVAVLGVVAYWRFVSPHYAMPVLLPLTLLLAPVFDRDRRWRMGGVLLAAAGLVAGQAVLAATEARKGGAAEAALVARAAAPGDGCLWVYDGYPALYMLTGSCLPTRWAFPGHLNMADEANGAALGTDPLKEVARILAARPVAIVDDFPAFERGSAAAHALVLRVLARDYRLAACIPTGPDRIRLVYRRRDAPMPSPGLCAPSVARRLGRR